MDLHLGDDSGIETTRDLVRALPDLAVLVITMDEDDESVVAAMRAGARGYLLKSASPAEVERGIRAVANGEAILGPQVAERAMATLTSGRTAVRVPFPELSDREREVLDLVARGFDNPTIARRMVLSPKTVRNHVLDVLTKLAIPDRASGDHPGPRRAGCQRQERLDVAALDVEHDREPQRSQRVDGPPPAGSDPGGPALRYDRSGSRWRARTSPRAAARAAPGRWCRHRARQASRKTTMPSSACSGRTPPRRRTASPASGDSTSMQPPTSRPPNSAEPPPSSDQVPSRSRVISLTPGSFS